jgi:hypothetical protein
VDKAIEVLTKVRPPLSISFKLALHLTTLGRATKMLCKFCHDLDIDLMTQPGGQAHHASYADLVQCALQERCELCAAVATGDNEGENLDSLGVPTSCWFSETSGVLEWRQVFVEPGS